MNKREKNDGNNNYTIIIKLMKYHSISMFAVFALLVLLQHISSINGERINFHELLNHNKEIESLKLHLSIELDNPLYWAKLGELYFDRNAKWKTGKYSSYIRYRVVQD